ncbi:hypothetical protein GPALN_011398 [Globodera pallida]|nr:hypothetical protein GPALN_011398 [Globodera pallida]
MGRDCGIGMQRVARAKKFWHILIKGNSPITVSDLCPTDTVFKCTPTISRVPLPPFPILLVLLFLTRIVHEVAGPGLKMPARLSRPLPSPVPSPSTYSIQFVVYATVTNVGAQIPVEKIRQNAAGDNRTARLVAELLEDLKQPKKQQQESDDMNQFKHSLEMNSTGIGTDIITWQLFNQCSRAFVRIRTDDGKVDARGGTGEADEECQISQLETNHRLPIRSALFSPELVAGERGARGLIRLAHRNLRTIRDPLCWLREDLTPSGYTSISATRPIGFSRAGRPLTHTARLSYESGRCFQFAKLISRRRVQHQWPKYGMNPFLCWA